MSRLCASLFTDPAAARTKAAYDAARSDGLSPPEATRAALREVAEALLDDLDRPMVYVALAGLQLADGRLEEWLKVIVLASLLNGEVHLPHPDTPGDPVLERLRDRLVKA